MDDYSPLPATEIKEKLITSFIETTSSSSEEAESFLETHQWNLDAAVSAFTENNVAEAATSAAAAYAESDGNLAARTRPSTFRINIPVSFHPPSGADSSDYIPSESSPSRLRLRSGSPSPPSRARHPLLSNRRGLAGNIFTLADISGGADSDSDEAQENDDDGGELIGTFVLDPKKGEDDDDEAKDSDEARYESQMVVMTFVTIWRNGFTVDDSTLKTLDNQEDADFLEVVERMESPREFDTEENNIRLRIKLIRRQEEDFIESPEPFTPFTCVGRTLSESDSASTEPQASSDSLSTIQPPSMDQVVDLNAPTTSIQIRLADGTRIVSRFNTHQAVRDVRGFIDASRPDGSRDYQLLIMGFPPKPLPDFDHSIEEAGIFNSVLIQKY